ncbi:Crp/Fnr family transcriptional regulator [Acidovorax sp. SUPP1855]|uniref:Crp/Fnr family transcriptional regulator n=1 Tax=Acidovorax sp. SUPP1855 TaxID=431774 RepID=UPI0023DE3A8B|nr:Crp/Fnr family transcriptional regulator [Acidovorax sp. SUPP1855]GKS85928.1 Crp/Fnr family transcriptional regulator [Acidovorax sp. SUPP1855]
MPHAPPLSPAHRRTLEGNPWFAALPAAQRGALLGAAERVHLQRGAMPFRQGDPVGAAGSGFYGLLAGTLKISTLRDDGREAILVLLEPGNWFGEITLIDGSPRTHDATALTGVDLLVVPPFAFAAQMADPVFANAMATLRGLRVRVVHRLLALARGDATQSATLRPSVAVPQEALAMMLGVTRQTLSKELNTLAQLGLIGLRYRRIELLQLEALQRVGGAN